MSEENSTEVAANGEGMDGGPGAPASPASVGRWLSETREAKGISVAEAAVALKLSPRQVEAMEADDWSRLPRTVMRGFVRNYARYLGEDARPLLAGLDRQQSLAETPALELKTGAPVSIPKEERASRQNFLLIFSGLVVLALAILIYYLMPAGWWQSGFEAVQNLLRRDTAVETSSGEPSSPPPPVPAAIPEAPAPTSQPATTQHTPPTPEPLPQPSPTSTVVVPMPAASPSIVSGKATLALSFEKSSWTEVRDRMGQVIFSRLSPAGSRHEISGEPPFSVTIGNASHVTLLYKGKPVDLSKRSKDDVARLTLE